MDWKKAQAEYKDERRSYPVMPNVRPADFAELEDDTERQQEQSEQSDTLRPIAYHEQPRQNGGESARQP